MPNSLLQGVVLQLLGAELGDKAWKPQRGLWVSSIWIHFERLAQFAAFTVGVCPLQPCFIAFLEMKTDRNAWHEIMHFQNLPLPNHCIDILRLCSGLSPSCHQWGTSLFLFSSYLTAILGRPLPMFWVWADGTFVFEKSERLFYYPWEPWFLTQRKGGTTVVRFAHVVIVEKPHAELTCKKCLQPNSICRSPGERHRCKHGTSCRERRGW